MLGLGLYACTNFKLGLQIFRFWMVTFLAVLLMVYTFLNLLGLLESAIMYGLQRSKKMFNGQTGLSVS